MKEFLTLFLSIEFCTHLTSALTTPSQNLQRTSWYVIHTEEQDTQVSVLNEIRVSEKKAVLLVGTQSSRAIIKSAVLSTLEELDTHILSSMEKILGDLSLIFEVDYPITEEGGSCAVVLDCTLLHRSIAATQGVTVLPEMERLCASWQSLVASGRQLVPEGQKIFTAAGRLPEAGKVSSVRYKISRLRNTRHIRKNELCYMCTFLNH